jgi:Predicted metalloendopeptidase
MRRLFLVIFLCLSTFAFCQQKNSSSEELPKLEHMSADQVNPQIDPCTDFYQYSCSKFFAANPIPPDRAAWGVAGPCSSGMRRCCARRWKRLRQKSRAARSGTEDWRLLDQLHE